MFPCFGRDSVCVVLRGLVLHCLHESAFSYHSTCRNVPYFSLHPSMVSSPIPLFSHFSLPPSLSFSLSLSHSLTLSLSLLSLSALVYVHLLSRICVARVCASISHTPRSLCGLQSSQDLYPTLEATWTPSDRLWSSFHGDPGLLTSSSTTTVPSTATATVVAPPPEVVTSAAPVVSTSTAPSSSLAASLRAVAVPPPTLTAGACSAVLAPASCAHPALLSHGRGRVAATSCPRRVVD